MGKNERKVIRTIKVKVIPGASENKIVGIRNDCLVVKLTSKPEKDKANKQLIDFLSRDLKVKKNQIMIAAGVRSRIKEIIILD
ncbi:MAG: DUF167 domain-containing protein [Patescibacteria group bacterium]